MRSNALQVMKPHMHNNAPPPMSSNVKLLHHLMVAMGHPSVLKYHKRVASKWRNSSPNKAAKVFPSKTAGKSKSKYQTKNALKLHSKVANKFPSRRQSRSHNKNVSKFQGNNVEMCQYRGKLSLSPVGFLRKFVDMEVGAAEVVMGEVVIMEVVVMEEVVDLLEVVTAVVDKVEVVTVVADIMVENKLAT